MILPRHMVMMFEINSEKAIITDEYVVTILSMSIFSVSVHLAKVLSEVRSSPYCKSFEFFENCIFWNQLVL